MNEADAGLQTIGDFRQFDCLRCGRYKITRTALVMLNSRIEQNDMRQRARISHAVRSLSDVEEWPTITSMNLDSLLSQPLPSIEAQLENLLRWAARQLNDDQLGSVEVPEGDALAGVVGALDGDRIDDVINLAVEDDLLRHVPQDCIGITRAGWRRLGSPSKPIEPATELSLQPRESPKSADSVISAHCNTCGGDRNAFMRATHQIAGSEDEVSWSNQYDILECCGCSSIFVRNEKWFSEHDWIDHDALGKPRLNRGIETKYWPPPARRKKPTWVVKITDSVLRTLIDELYTALDAGLMVMATTGARTLFDRASFLQVGDPAGGFPGKLQAMVSAGHISANDRTVLEALTDAGNASAHRGFAPDFDQLNALADILENYLERAFVLSDAADALRKATPPRPPKSKRP